MAPQTSAPLDKSYGATERATEALAAPSRRRYRKTLGVAVVVCALALAGVALLGFRQGVAAPASPRPSPVVDVQEAPAAPAAVAVADAPAAPAVAEAPAAPAVPQASAVPSGTTYYVSYTSGWCGTAYTTIHPGHAYGHRHCGHSGGNNDSGYSYCDSDGHGRVRAASWRRLRRKRHQHHSWWENQGYNSYERYHHQRHCQTRNRHWYLWRNGIGCSCGWGGCSCWKRYATYQHCWWDSRYHWVWRTRSVHRTRTDVVEDTNWNRWHHSTTGYGGWSSHSAVGLYWTTAQVGWTQNHYWGNTDCRVIRINYPNCGAMWVNSAGGRYYLHSTSAHSHRQPTHISGGFETYAGNHNAYCAAGSWSYHPPLRRVQCSRLSVSHSNRWNAGVWSYGSSVTVTCNTNYRKVHNAHGTYTFSPYCQSNRHWSGISSCQRKVCPTRRPAHCSQMPTGHAGNTYTHACRCNAGYTSLQNSATASNYVRARCVDNRRYGNAEWTYDQGTSSACYPKRCTASRDQFYHASAPYQYSVARNQAVSSQPHNSRKRLTCRGDFRPAKTSQGILCSFGNWESPRGQCVRRTCPALSSSHSYFSGQVGADRRTRAVTRVNCAGRSSGDPTNRFCRTSDITCAPGFYKRGSGLQCASPNSREVPLQGSNDGGARNLQACIGECDADSQCAAGLKCFQREHGEPIPGCSGNGHANNWDYCYNPATAEWRNSANTAAGSSGDLGCDERTCSGVPSLRPHSFVRSYAPRSWNMKVTLKPAATIACFANYEIVPTDRRESTRSLVSTRQRTVIKCGLNGHWESHRPSCRPINPCKDGTHQCAKGSTCVDKPLGTEYKCQCAPHQKGVHCKEAHNDCAACAATKVNIKISSGTLVALKGRVGEKGRAPTDYRQRAAGAAVRDWDQCFNLCEQDSRCIGVNYQASSKKCFGFQKVPSGGRTRSALGWRSAECRVKALLHETCGHGACIPRTRVATWSDAMKKSSRNGKVFGKGQRSAKHLRRFDCKCELGWNPVSNTNPACESRMRCRFPSHAVPIKSVNKGSGGCRPDSRCQKCQGDCDTDDDCAGSLKCYQRNGNNPAPEGCTHMVRDYDYCYDPDQDKHHWPCKCNRGYAGRLTAHRADVTAGDGTNEKYGWRVTSTCKPMACPLRNRQTYSFAAYGTGVTAAQGVFKCGGKVTKATASVADGTVCKLEPKHGYWCVSPGKCGFGPATNAEGLNGSGGGTFTPRRPLFKGQFPARARCYPYQCRAIGTTAADRSHFKKHHIKANCAGGAAAPTNPKCRFDCDPGYTLGRRGKGGVNHPDTQTLTCDEVAQAGKRQIYHESTDLEPCKGSKCNAQWCKSKGYQYWRSDLGMCAKSRCTAVTAAYCQQVSNYDACAAQCELSRSTLTTSWAARFRKLHQGKRMVKWPKFPECRMKQCRAFTVKENAWYGHARPENRDRTCGQTGPYQLGGRSCTLRCRPGYAFSGEAHGATKTIQCQMDGNWQTRPRCYPRRCLARYTQSLRSPWYGKTWVEKYFKRSWQKHVYARSRVVTHQSWWGRFAIWQPVNDYDCRPGFKFVQKKNPNVCKAGYRVERHPGNRIHGDICRSTKSAAWYPMPGCVKPFSGGPSKRSWNNKVADVQPWATFEGSFQPCRPREPTVFFAEKHAQTRCSYEGNWPSAPLCEPKICPSVHVPWLPGDTNAKARRYAEKKETLCAQTYVVDQQWRVGPVWRKCGKVDKKTVKKTFKIWQADAHTLRRCTRRSVISRTRGFNGPMCQFDCLNGYKSIGKQRYQVCNLDTDATWPDAPVCDEKMCPYFEEAADSHTECPGGHKCRPALKCGRTGATDPNGTCTATCPSDYVMEDKEKKTIKCTITGKWETHRPTCWLKNGVRFPLAWAGEYQAVNPADGTPVEVKVGRNGDIAVDFYTRVVKTLLIPSQNPFMCPGFPCGMFRVGKDTWYVSYEGDHFKAKVAVPGLAAARAKLGDAQRAEDDARSELKHLTADAAPASGFGAMKIEAAKIFAAEKGVAAAKKALSVADPECGRKCRNLAGLQEVADVAAARYRHSKRLADACPPKDHKICGEHTTEHHEADARKAEAALDKAHEDSDDDEAKLDAELQHLNDRVSDARRMLTGAWGGSHWGYSWWQDQIWDQYHAINSLNNAYNRRPWWEKHGWWGHYLRQERDRSIRQRKLNVNAYAGYMEQQHTRRIRSMCDGQIRSADEKVADIERPVKDIRARIAKAKNAVISRTKEVARAAGALKKAMHQTQFTGKKAKKVATLRTTLQKAQKAQAQADKKLVRAKASWALRRDVTQYMANNGIKSGDLIKEIAADEDSVLAWLGVKDAPKVEPKEFVKAGISVVGWFRVSVSEDVFEYTDKVDEAENRLKNVNHLPPNKSKQMFPILKAAVAKAKKALKWAQAEAETLEAAEEKAVPLVERLGNEADAAKGKVAEAEQALVKETAGKQKEKLEGANGSLEMAKMHLADVEKALGLAQQRVTSKAKHYKEVKAFALRVKKMSKRQAVAALVQRIKAAYEAKNAFTNKRHQHESKTLAAIDKQIASQLTASNTAWVERMYHIQYSLYFLHISKHLMPAAQKWPYNAYSNANTRYSNAIRAYNAAWQAKRRILNAFKDTGRAALKKKVDAAEQRVAELLKKLAEQLKKHERMAALEAAKSAAAARCPAVLKLELREEGVKAHNVDARCWQEKAAADFAHMKLAEAQRQDVKKSTSASKIDVANTRRAYVAKSKSLEKCKSREGPKYAKALAAADKQVKLARKRAVDRLTRRCDRDKSVRAANAALKKDPSSKSKFCDVISAKAKYVIKTYGTEFQKTRADRVSNSDACVRAEEYIQFALEAAKAARAQVLKARIARFEAATKKALLEVLRQEAKTGPFTGVNGPPRGTDKQFYEEAPNGDMKFKSTWSWSRGFFADGGSRLSSKRGTGQLASATFVVSGNQLSFKTGYGGRSGTAVRLYKDYGLATQEVVREEVPDGSKKTYKVSWDVAGLLNEVVTIVVADKDPNAHIYFDFLQMESSVLQCLPDCVSFKRNVLCPRAPHNAESVFSEEEQRQLSGRNHKCMEFFGSVYVPTHKTSGGGHVYCTADTSSPENSFDDPIKSYNVAGIAFPDCVSFRSHRSGYVVTAGPEKRQFFFTAENSVQSGTTCVYPTTAPRCAAFVGALRRLRSIKNMGCEEVEPEPACARATYNQLCNDTEESPCGERKQTQDILRCCEKNTNDAGAGCLSSLSGRRRLGTSLRITKDLNEEESDAEKCSSLCLSMGEGDSNNPSKCVAWRLKEGFKGKKSCVVATKCAPKGSPAQIAGNWKTAEDEGGPHWFSYQDIYPYKNKSGYTKKEWVEKK